MILSFNDGPYASLGEQTAEIVRTDIHIKSRSEESAPTRTRKLFEEIKKYAYFA